MTVIVNFFDMFLHFNYVSLYCRVGFIWVLGILDITLQININIRVRVLYFHNFIITVLRLNIAYDWSNLTGSHFNTIWIGDCSMVCIADFHKILQRFLCEWASNLGSKLDLVLVRSSLSLLVMCGPAVCWRFPKKTPIIKQWLFYISMKISDQLSNMDKPICQQFLIWLLGSTFDVFLFQTVSCLVVNQVQNTPDLINTPSE